MLFSQHLLSNGVGPFVVIVGEVVAVRVVVIRGLTGLVLKCETLVVVETRQVWVLVPVDLDTPVDGQVVQLKKILTNLLGIGRPAHGC